MSVSIWTAFLVNFMFGRGTAAGGTAFAALLDLTGARWAASLRPTAVRFHRFLPISIVLYLVLLIGARAIYPWVSRPIGSSWLRFWPFAIRDFIALAALAAAGAWFSASLASTRRTAMFLTTYSIAFSILAIDLVMSLAAPWGTTLFPAYLFTANVYAAIAAVALVTAAIDRAREVRGVPDRHEWLADDSRVSDLGKVLLGFSLRWMYLVWSQFLVVWYANLGDEVGYVMSLLYGRWRPLAWVIWTTRFALPFIVLLPRAGRTGRPVLVVSSIVVAGFWLECFLLVTPAASGLPPVWMTAAMTAIFFAAFAAITRTRST